MCKDYANTHFSNCEFFLYDDEGFSGGNTDRPMFKKLIKDIRSRKIDVLMCYRLDRISRNVAHFSEMLELLNNNSIEFVSIKEQFDTSTPMGRAMIYISSVFAQLERDTIAERITDNFTELAKAGRFLNGNPPEGLKLKKIYTDDGKPYNILEIIPDEAEKVKLVYQKYIQWESNEKVVRYLIEQNIKNKNGNRIANDWLSRILAHPLYAVADKNTYLYFKKLGCQIVSQESEFNGEYGITVFRRTKNKNGRHTAKNEYENWIIGVGKHEGIILSKDWIRTQNILQSKSHLGEKRRRVTGNHGLISGLLKCGNCGDYMRPMSIYPDRFYYKCLTKDRTRKVECDIKNIRGDKLDKDVVIKIKEMLEDTNGIYDELNQNKQYLKKAKDNNKLQTKEIKKNIDKNEKAIKNLIMNLSKTVSEIMIEKITEQVTILDNRTKELKLQLVELEETKDKIEADFTESEIFRESINKINSKLFDEIEDTVIKRNLLKTIIKDIIWDGKEITINFY